MKILKYKKNNTYLMIKHTVLVCLILVIATVSTIAQVHLHYMDSLKVKNYDKIVELTENHYADKDKGKGTGYKQFERWKNLYSKRLDKRGNIVNFTAINKIERTKALNRLIPNNSDWTPVAALKYEGNDIGEGGLGRINCIAIHPTNDNIIYAGAPNSFWKTETGGADWNDTGAAPAWIPLMEDVPAGVSGIAIDRDSPETVYALTGDGDAGHSLSLGVYKSIDGGMNWNPTNLQWNFGDFVRGYKLKRHSSGSLFAVTNKGIFKSDGDDNWINTISKKFFDLEFHPTMSNIMYASTEDKVYRSDDSGDTWSEVFEIALTFNEEADKWTYSRRIELAVSDVSPDYVYALSGGKSLDGMFQGLYRSTDQGLTFNLRSNTPNILGYGLESSGNQATYDLTITVNPSDSEEVHVGGIHCNRSNDGGQTWVRTSTTGRSPFPIGAYTHADIHWLVFSNNKLYCGSDGGIYKSEIPSSTNILTVFYDLAILDWKNISYGLQNSQVYEITTSRDPIGSGVSYGTQDNGQFLAYNQNEDWNKWIFLRGGDVFDVDFDPFNSNIVYSKALGDLVRYNLENGERTSFRPAEWLSNRGPFDLNKIDGSLTMFHIDNVYRLENPSTDSNADWINLSEDKLPEVISNSWHSSLEVAPSNSDVIFVGLNAKFDSDVTRLPYLFMTYDKGENWRHFATPQSVQHITFHPTNPKIAWITLTGRSDEPFGRVFKTVNRGNSWQDISNNNGLPQVPVNCISYQNGSNNMLYVGTDIGVYYKDENTSIWRSFNLGLPGVTVTDLEINYCTDMIYAGTFGRGVWESPLQDSSFSSDLTLMSDHSDSNIFLSDSYINSTADVGNTTSVVYQGSTAVCLQPGFIAKPVGINYFCAQIIDPCNVTIPFTANRVISDIVQNMDDVQLENIGGNKILEEIFEDANLKILGNPSPNETAVSFDLETQSKVSLHIYDQQGKFIKQILDNVNLDSGNHQYNLQLSDHQKGVYFIALSYGGKKSIRKLVKL